MLDDFHSLLPSNSTELERDLERLTGLEPFYGPVDVMRTAKIDKIDSFVPFLIWEYGLGEIMPYLEDPQRALSEGILWQRIRGTPRSLEIALGWLGLTAVIEQEETGQYFAQFMVDTGEVIRDPVINQYIVELSRLSAPARSEVSRLFNDGYDVRRLKLSDGGELNHHLLSDYSGIHDPLGVRISYGETFTGYARLWEPEAESPVTARHTQTVWQHVWYPDVFRLSVSELSEFPRGVHTEIFHSHLFTGGNEIWAIPNPPTFEARKYQLAQIVLSDSDPETGGLSDLNGVLAPLTYLYQTEDTPELSENLYLSDTPNSFVLITALERTYTEHPVSGIGPLGDVLVTGGRAGREQWAQVQNTELSAIAWTEHTQGSDTAVWALGDWGDYDSWRDAYSWTGPQLVSVFGSYSLTQAEYDELVALANEWEAYYTALDAMVGGMTTSAALISAYYEDWGTYYEAVDDMVEDI
jgi:P2-related tail formation protein